MGVKTVCCENCPYYYSCERATTNMKGCCNKCPYFYVNPTNHCRLLEEEKKLEAWREALRG